MYQKIYSRFQNVNYKKEKITSELFKVENKLRLEELFAKVALIHLTKCLKFTSFLNLCLYSFLIDFCCLLKHDDKLLIV